MIEKVLPVSAEYPRNNAAAVVGRSDHARRQMNHDGELRDHQADHAERLRMIAMARSGELASASATTAVTPMPAAIQP